MKNINTDQLKQMLYNGNEITLVEVLDEENFKKGHIPGAVNIPLDKDFTGKIQKAIPEKDSTVVVYCGNEKCTMSPKAAQKMDELGYTHVFDYEPGKQGWKEAGNELQS